MNTFGKKLTLTTFGESHGKALGCILDGVPAGLKIDEAFIQSELDRRKPGKSKLETGRKEADKVEILSGTFEGVSTGTPIAMIIFNTNQKSKDYENVKDLFRPGHADFTYFHKYGLRDYRGGGRSSARETAARVAGGATADGHGVVALGVEVEEGVEGGHGVALRLGDAGALGHVLERVHGQVLVGALFLEPLQDAQQGTRPTSLSGDDAIERILVHDPPDRVLRHGRHSCSSRIDPASRTGGEPPACREVMTPPNACRRGHR